MVRRSSIPSCRRAVLRGRVKTSSGALVWIFVLRAPRSSHRWPGLCSTPCTGPKHGAAKGSRGSGRPLCPAKFDSTKVARPALGRTGNPRVHQRRARATATNFEFGIEELALSLGPAPSLAAVPSSRGRGAVEDSPSPPRRHARGSTGARARASSAAARAIFARCISAFESAWRLKQRSPYRHWPRDWKATHVLGTMSPFAFVPALWPLVAPLPAALPWSCPPVVGGLVCWARRGFGISERSVAFTCARTGNPPPSSRIRHG